MFSTSKIRRKTWRARYDSFGGRCRMLAANLRLRTQGAKRRANRLQGRLQRKMARA